MHEEFIFELI